MNSSTVNWSIVENMTEGYSYHRIITDESGAAIDYEFIDINAAFEKLTGLKRSQVIGKRARDVLTGLDSDPADWLKRFGNVALTGDMFEFDEFFQPLERWFSGTVYSPEPNYFVVIFLESTITRQIASQTHFPLSAVKNSPNILFKLEIDAGWSVEYISENISLFGYSAEEFVSGKIKFRDFIHPGDRQRVSDEFKCFVERGASHYKMRYRFFDRNNMVRWLDEWAVSIKNELGRVTHRQGILVDITEHKRIEEVLQQEKKNAEQSNKAKSDFLANMSHEIRTPMNGVTGMVDLLLGTELDEEQTDFANFARKSAYSLLDLINDILDFSKIEAGKLEVEDLDFNLRHTLEDLMQIMAVRIEEKELELICEIAPEVPSLVRGAPCRLRQVLTNLIGNAIKFTDRGEVSLQVKLASPIQDEKTVLHFQVKDTGIGLSPEKAAQLFQPYQQAESNTEHLFGGTGLGLSISKQLVELMGGNIGVESRKGSGSIFWITLPVSLTLEKDTIKPEPVNDEELAQKNILLVDDNCTSRHALSNMLEYFNCRYEAVSDPESAVNKLRGGVLEKDPFHIAILNMCMTNIDGEILGQIIKEDPLIKDVRIVMLTAVGKRGDARRLEKLGFSAYLTKPVKRRQLYNCLLTLIGRESEMSTGCRGQMITRHTLSENQRRRIRILLAEDNLINRKLALKILDNLGYRADVAVNGLEALKRLKSTAYDLILMDVQMPEMDGLTATREFRQNEKQNGSRNSKQTPKTTPIIAMTANAMKGDREKCLNAGMNDYVTKPIKAGELVSVIERWLSHKQNSDNNIPMHLKPYRINSGKLQKNTQQELREAL